MPNGVRSRGNSRHANRRRNAQRDNLVSAEMVAPEIVIQAEPISVQADPDITQQLQQRIAQLEAQVKQVKQNYKSAKKQAETADNIITNTSHFFKGASELIGMKPADMLTYQWLNNFKGAITELKQERDSERLLHISFKEVAELAHDESAIAEEKYQKAISGTLLAFQETEIQDLQDENDKLKQLNKLLLKKELERKDEAESLMRINSNMTEDFCKVVNKIGSRKVSIEGIHISTANLMKAYMENNPSEDMACCIGKNRGLVIQGKKLIDTDKNRIYGYNPKTKDVYDDDDGEVLGKLIKKNGKLKIQWD